MVRKIVDAGFHITRAELNASRLETILNRRPRFSAEQKSNLMAAHANLTQPMPAQDLLMTKFRRTGRRIVDRIEIGTIGRYHYWRNCLYFTEEREAVFAEAAYYMHAYDGVKVGPFSRDYRIISAQILDAPIPISRRYPRADLICDGHPLQIEIEDRAIANGWCVISAPSARRDGHRTIIVYDANKVIKAVDVERVRLSYDNKNPAVTWASTSLSCNSFVIRTILY